jgi:predicted 3-demethylubiquinone-9 3-methyltransferase (glyoxalase superfamily)
LFVSCETQEEVDELWEKLLEGGEPLRCGWLKDKFGVSWQVIPKTLMELLSDPDPHKSKKVREAMMKMVKIDVQGLKDAYAS